MQELPEAAAHRAAQRLVLLKLRQDELKSQLEAIDDDLRDAVHDGIRAGLPIRRICSLAGVSTRKLYSTWGVLEKPAEQAKQPESSTTATRGPGPKRRAHKSTQVSR